jgi:hypothetical protein
MVLENKFEVPAVKQRLFSDDRYAEDNPPQLASLVAK